MLAGEPQHKAELLARESDLEITLVVPERWVTDGRTIRAQAPTGASYTFVATGVFRPGDFHLHVLPGLPRLLAGIAPDLVHVDEEPYNLACAHGVWAARRAGARAIFFAWQNLERAYPLPFRIAQSYVHANVSGAIAGTGAAAAVQRSKGFEGPLWVVPQFGVDPSRFAAPARGRARREFVVGFAGRLVRPKGVDVLLRAAEHVLRADPDRHVRVDIAGIGPAEAELKALATELGIGDRIRWRGWLPDTELPEFYAGLDVFVLTSRTTPAWTEQFGRVLVEAMASGVPCIGSEAGEIPDVLGEAGVVVAEGDVAALAAAITALRDDEELRRRLAEAGRRRVDERFTADRVARDTATAYRSAMNSGAAPVP